MKILVKYKKRKRGYISISEVMKVKRIILAFVYILSTLISLYFIVLWNPKIESSYYNMEPSVSAFNINNSYNIIDEKQKSGNKIENELKISNEGSIEEISYTSKDRLKKILYTLSINDYEYVYDLKKRENKEEAIREFISIIKKRLSNKDYEEIRVILSPYINFEDIY